MARSTKRQLYEREQAIMQMIRRGAGEKTIVDKLSRELKCARSTIKAHYDRIYDEMIQQNKEQLGQIKASLLAQAAHVGEMALEKENLKTSLDAINLQAKIAGVYSDKETKDEKMPDIKIGRRELTPINGGKKVK